jgi:hypothetical protein
VAAKRNSPARLRGRERGNVAAQRERERERVFGGGELASGAAAGPTPEEDEAPLLRAHSGGCSAILFPDCCLGRSGCQRGTTARRRRRTWCGFGGGGSTYRPKKWRRMAGTKCNEYRPMSSGKPSRWPASFVFADHVCSSSLQCMNLQLQATFVARFLLKQAHVLSLTLSFASQSCLEICAIEGMILVTTRFLCQHSARRKVPS